MQNINKKVTVTAFPLEGMAVEVEHPIGEFEIVSAGEGETRVIEISGSDSRALGATQVERS